MAELDKRIRFGEGSWKAAPCSREIWVDLVLEGLCPPSSSKSALHSVSWQAHKDSCWRVQIGLTRIGAASCQVPHPASQDSKTGSNARQQGCQTPGALCSAASGAGGSRCPAPKTPLHLEPL